jgi:high-affinity iron transporter
MRNNARAISSGLRAKLESAIQMGSVAVVVMATLAVGREGLETPFFFFAAIQAAGETVQPLAGSSSGSTCRSFSPT